MNRIKELREQRGWLQKDLEQRMSLGKGNISKYETEVSGLSPELINEFCDLFGVTADYLLCRSNAPTAVMTDAEAELLAAYRAASEDARAVVDLTLKPWRTSEQKKAIS